MINIASWAAILKYEPKINEKWNYGIGDGPPLGLDLPLLLPFLLPLLGLTPSGLFMGSISTEIYTSELILCFTICALSATRHNIHMYPYFSDTTGFCMESVQLLASSKEQ